MKIPFSKKNYIARVPVYLFLLLWYTGKFALVQTCKYAPLFILVPRRQMHSIVKPWKRMKEVAYKVIKHRSFTWYCRETNHNRLSSFYYYFNVFGWKHLHRIKEKWWRRDLRNKRISMNGCHNKRFFRDGHSQLLKLFKKTAILADRKTLKSFEYNTKFSLYKHMPWRAMSRLWGQINSIELPYWLRKPAYSLYIWMFDCHIEEAVVEDISRYRNLSEFFRRMLKPEMRPIDTNALLTSPADGRVLYCGKVKNGVLEQVKGVTYSLCGFFGPAQASSHCGHSTDGRHMGKQCQPASGTLGNNSSQSLRHRGFLEDHPVNGHSKNSLLFNPLDNQLFYCVIYLAPGDYHRFHSPADWHVQKRRHFPGELFSVKPSVARWLKGLFNMNERVVYFGEWVHGFFSMTPVGATNVGSISIYIDKDLKTNTPNRLRKGCYLDKDFINHEFGSGLRKSVEIDHDEILDEVSDDGSDGIIDEENLEEDSQEDISDTSSTCSKETSCPGVFIKKGKLFGEFNLGSTVVLLFEAPKGFKFSVTPGQRINYGQALSAC